MRCKVQVSCAPDAGDGRMTLVLMALSSTNMVILSNAKDLAFAFVVVAAPWHGAVFSLESPLPHNHYDGYNTTNSARATWA